MWESDTGMFTHSEEICQQTNVLILVLDSQVNAFY